MNRKETGLPDAHDPIRTQHLVIRCQLGERDAFAELIGVWHASLWRHLRRVLDADESADDASQEVWLRVVRSLPRLRDTAAFPAWLFRIAHFVTADRLREKYREASGQHAELAGDHAMDPPVNPPDALEADEREHLHAAIATIAPVYREALGLFYLQELSVEEVAGVVGVSTGTVKSRLHRGRAALREALTP